VIEPVVSGSMAALMEAYASQINDIEATLEILREEDGPALAAVPMRVGLGSSMEVMSLTTQFNTSALPPGRYLARGTVRQGGRTHGHLLRPFRIVAAAASSDAGAAMPAPGVVPNEMAMVLLGGVANFDRKALLSPATLTSMFALADARPAGSRAAVKEARGGDLGGAAMTALSENDQVLATFLKGLELYQASQLDRAAMQFTNSMQMAPTFAPSRLFLGASLAEANRHKEAAGLIQSAATTPPNAALARIAGEEWIKAGQPALAITPLELAVQQPNADANTKKLLGFAYVLGGRPAEAATMLAPYLDANPTDSAALLAAIYSTYQRHLAAPQPATLAADKTSVTKWAKAYAGTKGPMQPLVAAWVKHVQGQK
jgi:tetratricopeptide (TPR) repeat protein